MKRRCREHGCDTILSFYNSEDRCSLHALPQFGDVGIYERRRRQAELNDPRPFDEVFAQACRPEVWTPAQLDASRVRWSKQQLKERIEA